MSNTRAFYSVVQYVPDFGRAEAANTGVVLFVPAAMRVEIRMSRTLARVRQFFAPGRQQLRRLEFALESLKNRLTLARDEFKDEHDFARFVAARADFVQLTAPRLVMIDESMNELSSLFSQLVGDEDEQCAGIAGTRIPHRIAEVFGKLEAERRAWRPGSIVVPTIRRKLEVSFAYQNGRTNFVRLESLGKGARLDARLAKLGFNGQLIHEHEINDKPGKLVVVSADPSVKTETEQQFENALEEFHVRFIRYKQVADFAAEVERTAH